MTPSQLAFIEAHKARRQRFAQAAARNAAKSMPAVMAPLVQPEVIEFPAPPKPPAHPPFKLRRLWYRAVEVVARECGVPVSDILSASRKAPAVFARQIAIGIICEITTLSFPQIGHRLGGRDHTTILHARNRAKALFASEAFRNRVDQLKAEILS